MNRPHLSGREQQVLTCLAHGETNKEIARSLFNITESTVKVHLKAILRKIGANNRTKAAIWALMNGYGSLPIVDPHLMQTNSAVAPEGALVGAENEAPPRGVPQDGRMALKK
jgi:DNA-binding CsgD family transcriptional regulator